MNLQDLFGSRRNRKPGKSVVSRKVQRKLFLESLESRQLLAVAPLEDESPVSGFEGNYLPPAHYRVGTEGALSGPTGGDPLAIGVGYLRANAGAYGLLSGDFADGLYRVTSRHTDPTTGVTNIYLQQMHNGLPVADAVANMSVLADGRVLSAGVNFVSGLSHATTFPTPLPALSALEAVTSFASAANISFESEPAITAGETGFNKLTVLNDPEISQDPIKAELQYVPRGGAGVELAWRFTVRTPGNTHMYETSVSATSGGAGQITRLYDAVDHATYDVLPRPVQDPLFGPFQTVVNPHSPLASRFEWHDTNGIAGPEFTDTRGNNIIAQEDTDGNNAGGNRPNGGAGLVFTAPVDFTQPPAFNQFAGLINAFYWTNLTHDVLYHHGFDEAAGNFQVTNYTGAGVGGDPVILDTQDPLAINNAFMIPTPEGISPMMAMGIFTATAPARDSSFDGGIVAHEYFHAVSDRLTGGPSNFGSLFGTHSDAMGEGWSDWFSLVMTAKATDTRGTPRTIGNWVAGQSASGPGIRRLPYSFDKSINPRVFGDFNGDALPGFFNSESHNAGEIWASALWDMTQLLIGKYGFSTDLYAGNGGNNLALRFVIDALKLQPNNPSFLQARDSIIAADFARTGGANFELLWQAFARRGMGRSAVDGFNTNSLVIIEAFDVPPGPALVTGTIFNDSNNSLKRETGEGGLGGFVVYVDANNNKQLDSGETRTTTASDGTYSMRVFASGNTWIRQVLQPNWTQTLPQNNAGRQISLVRGQEISQQNFGNFAVPGQINGLVWNDINGDGVRNNGESAAANVVVYIDLNHNGVLNLLEPSAITDSQGRFAIKNVPPGTHTVTVLMQPGTTGVAPQETRVVSANQTVTGVNLPIGQRELDFGDAPDSYGTTRANNGARHGVFSDSAGTLRLGALIDAEADGNPTTTATGDDTTPLPPDPLPDPLPQSPDDEDGVVFLGGLTPGFPTTVQVTVNTDGHFAGRLHGWIDFNRDGDFFDAGEKIISNVPLNTGVHNLTFTVPTTAAFGSTYARFRYGYETDLGPTGNSLAGEVEDYTVNLLANVPIAAPDAFAVKQGSSDNVLDVLANDTTTTFGPPSIIPGSFPATLPSGSTLRLNAAGDRILFTPGPFSLGDETFTYRVTDGNTESAPGLVTVNIGIRDPLALDDTVTIPFATPPVVTQINVLANDIFPFANTTIVDVRKITTDPATGPASMTIAAGGAALNFQPPANFKGTIIYEYTIADADPTTNDATGLLTIQIVDVIAGVPTPDALNYTAALSMQILDPISQLPISAVNVGQEFLVRVLSRDLRPGGDRTDRGVEAAYLDMLFNRQLVEPVLDPSNPNGFAITFSSDYTLAQSGTANAPAPGQIDEVGAAHVPTVVGSDLNGLGPGTFTVFTVRMRAKAPTPAGQPTTIVGSPAELPNEVIVMPDNPDADPTPILLPDERVFLAPSTPLTITGVGEAEFSNFFNPLDVNGDFSVSPIDAALVINELNSGGSQALSPMTYAAKGFVRPTNLLDVNMDSFLAPIDAVLVINHLNSQTVLQAQMASSLGEGEGAAQMTMLAGEGEADGGLAANGSADEALLTALLLSASEDQSSAPAADNATSDSPADQVLQASATGGISPVVNEKPTPLFRSRFVNVDTDAADEVFATFAGSLQSAPSSHFSFGDRHTKSRLVR